MSSKAKVRNIVPVPLAGGMADFVSFDNLSDPKDHVAIGFGDWQNQKAPLVRVHSECLTGDVFDSEKCDCGNQLDEARNRCRTENGIILYLRQEGRGIGLYNKLDAYAHQNQGADTYEANRLIHQPEDARNFDVAAEMLNAMGFDEIKLFTNNPNKKNQLVQHGINVLEMIPTKVYLKEHNVDYLKAKKKQHKHTLSLPTDEAS